MLRIVDKRGGHIYADKLALRRESLGQKAVRPCHWVLDPQCGKHSPNLFELRAQLADSRLAAATMIPNRKRATALRSTVLLGITNAAGYTLPFGSICSALVDLVAGSVSDPEIAKRISGSLHNLEATCPRSGQMGPRQCHVQGQ